MIDRLFPFFPDGRRGVSIAARLALMIVLGVGALFSAIVLYGYFTSRAALEREFAERMENLGRAAENEFLRIPGIAESATRDLAEVLLQFSPPPEKLAETMKRLLESHPDISALTIGFSREGADPRYGNYCPDASREGGSVRLRDLAGEVDWTVQEWYQLPLQMGRALWTEPFFGEGGGLMVSYAIPVYDASWRYLATVCASLELHRLAGVFSAMPIGGRGYAFMITGDGTFVSHPRRELLMRETMFSVAEMEDRTDLVDLGRRMIRGETGTASLYDPLRGRLMVFFRPVGAMGWSIGILFPEEEALADITRLRRVQGLLGLGGLIALVVAGLFISGRISGPIRLLKDSAARLASGDLEAPLPPVAARDEVGLLTASFASMRDDLVLHLERLKTEIAVRERVAGELDIARSIQMSLVPRTFPPFPDDRRFDLHACLEPAREIGGDFYDFFLADDDHLLLVIGDVSGKGIPAALFMAVTRSFVKALASDDGRLSPAKLMAAVNDRLAEGNDACMFVTLCFILVDLRDGSFTYACGGHPLPRLIDADGATPLPRVAGALAGPAGGVKFGEGTGRLRDGAALLLFTDGVTEALDPDGRLLGEETMDRWLAEARDLGAEALVREMRRRLAAFANGAEQSDDITILCFRYGASSLRASIQAF